LSKRWTEYLLVAELPEAVRNPKSHDEDGIAASIDRFGYVEQVVIDERTGRLVSGHGRRADLLRREAAGEQPPDGIDVDDGGRWLVPVSRGWSSSSDAEAEAFVVAANRLVERGGWQLDLLTEVLKDLSTTDLGLTGVGYTSDELDVLVARLDTIHVSEHERQRGDPDELPAVPEEPVTRRGDVWLLGTHRVMCGDSRDAGDVATLLDGATVNVAFTSPPYADRREYDASSGFRPIPPDEYVAWFAPVAALVLEHLAADGSWFVNIKPGADGLDRELYVYDLVLAHAREWGWHLGDEFCWERNGVPGRVALRFKNQWESVFHFARERWKMRPDNVKHRSDDAIIPAGVIEGQSKNWQGSGKPSGEPASRRADGKRAPHHGDRQSGFGEHQGVVGSDAFAGLRAEGWAYPGNRLPTFLGSHQAVGHAAAFPVGLPAFFVKAYTDAGDVIYDPFVGSGSTILAADQEDRRGYGMELSPAYCDVVCRRWQHVTGTLPVRADTGDAVDFPWVAAPTEE
jgi:DNA modification methylase